ncbi:Metallo-beta-lactamase superfamily protein [Mycena kentingensis (nom. inval.)]|nr:Metallo-beta-lactamase superfamily protein [Mycena kentingensis (nom. inval.)]
MSTPAFDIPSSTSTVSVKMFDLISDHAGVKSSAAMFFQPVLPGTDNFACPIYAFFIENSTTKERIMFDLGPRKDLENAAPFLAAAVKAGYSAMPVDKDITEQLVESGIALDSISAVVWSHGHADHTGDMSLFPSSVDLVVSNELSTETADTDPNSFLLASDFAGRKLVRVDLEKSSLTIGGFRAHDYFGDGSFYLLDVPGHQHGHLSALARVAENDFVFLGADACHHAGVLRPTALLHERSPCPGALLAATRTSVSHTHFPSATSSAEGEFDLAARTKPMFTVASNGYFVDVPAAEDSVSKMSGVFDPSPDVFVVLAHDESLLPIIGKFPVVLDDWKARGWKKDATWAFLEEGNPAFSVGTAINASCAYHPSTSAPHPYPFDMASSSRAAAEHTYESQNDQQLDDLHSKLRTLRGITTDIYDDVESQNRLLDDTGDRFSNFGNSLTATARRAGQTFNLGENFRTWRVVLYVLGAFFAFLVLRKMYGWWAGPAPAV